MTSRVRWEGVDEGEKSRNGADRPSENNAHKKLAFFCSAVKTLSPSHQSFSPPDMYGEETPIDAFKTVGSEPGSTSTISEHDSNAKASTSRDSLNKPHAVEEGEALLDLPQEQNTKRPFHKDEMKVVIMPNTLPSSMAASESKGQNAKRPFHKHEMKAVILPNTLPLSMAVREPLSSGQTTPNPFVNDHSDTSWKLQGHRSMVDMLSAVYGILLVLMGVAFPISQVISNEIPTYYYEGFYTYLYFVAIIFFAYVYLLLKTHVRFEIHWRQGWYRFKKTLGMGKNDPDLEKEETFHYGVTDVMTNKLRVKLGRELDPTKSANNHGSFYLRMGAVVFGTGSMIYSGLEFGQYFEMSSNPACNDIIVAIQPAARLMFTFFQMYFVFLNAKMQILKGSNIIIGRFGLMHMTATNLCVWLNVIVQETKHEILHFTHGHSESSAHGSDHALDHASHGHHNSSSDLIHQLVNGTAEVFSTLLGGEEDLGPLNLNERHHLLEKRSLTDDCHRSNVMGTLTQNAGPFLFPCAIEYSLICAAIMYEIWKHTGHDNHHGVHNGASSQSSASHSPLTPGTPHTPRTPGNRTPGGSIRARRSPHHYSVDCTNANKGLFFGIFTLVLTIIAMILFFVLINHELEEHRILAVTEIHLAELVLYMLTLAAVLIGLIQVNQLKFDSARKLDLDNFLLIIALTGVIAYNIFTIIGTQFSTQTNTMLVMLNALAALIQGCVQTIFVLDASKRQLYTKRQLRRKPGREIITFLMVVNFAMWAVITLEKSRFDAHPVQNAFFGQWPWAIITNISSPLAIFYRYHSTVCLCEVWKKCYKVRATE